MTARRCAQFGGLAAGLFMAGAAAAGAPALDLSRLRSPYAADAELGAHGLARTAVERDLDRGRSSAAVGFLCGRQPDPVTSGGAAAYGVDPRGRFIGAQLRLHFR
jgi:hypothetical protein